MEKDIIAVENLKKKLAEKEKSLQEKERKKEEALNKKLMQTLLKRMSKNDMTCIVDFPDFKKVKAEVIGISLVHYRNVQVKFLEDIFKEERVLVRERSNASIWGYDEDNDQYVNEMVPYKEDWINIKKIIFE